MNELRSPLTDLLFLVVFCRMVYNIVAGILIFSVGRIRYRKAPTHARVRGGFFISYQTMPARLDDARERARGGFARNQGKIGSAVHLQSYPVYVIPVHIHPVPALLQVLLILLLILVALLWLNMVYILQVAV